MKRLLEAGRQDRPSEAVPAGFSLRVMRSLRSSGQEDPVWIWVRGLRTAMLASVAVALVACTFGPALARSDAFADSSETDIPASSASEEDPIDQSDAG